MREKTCCFTGHRYIPERELEKVKARLEQTILALYERNVVYYGAGGALGFDALAAETVLRLRETHPKLRADPRPALQRPDTRLEAGGRCKIS